MATTTTNTTSSNSNHNKDHVITHLGQYGLNHRMNELRKPATGVWNIHTHTNHLSNFSARNHSTWFGGLGLANHDHARPIQISFSNQSIGDSTNTVNGTDVALKNKAKEIFQSHLFFASVTPPPNNSVMNGRTSMKGRHFMHASSINYGVIDANKISHLLSVHNNNANYDPYNHFLKSMSNYTTNQNLFSSNPVQYPSYNLKAPCLMGNCVHNNINNHPIITSTTDGVNNMNINTVSDDEGDDGRIHSLPYKKNGPYTCPRCNQQFPTSQSFAAHATRHYKYESKAQRKKRLMSRIRKRNLRLQMVNGCITLVPDSSQARVVRNTSNTRFAHDQPAAVKVEVNQIVTPLGMGTRASGVKIKLESNV